MAGERQTDQFGLPEQWDAAPDGSGISHKTQEAGERQTLSGGEACEDCGHALSEHAESGWGPNTVCVVKLPTFPDGGWYGVCPCVRSGVPDGR